MRTQKEITASINSIQHAGKKLDDKIQSVALEVLEHIKEHKEASLACKLYAALPNGARKNALVAWMLAFGEIKVATGKNKGTIPLLWNKEGNTDLAGAAESPWFTFKKEPAPSEAFDFDKALQALIKKAQKAAQDQSIKVQDNDVLRAVLALQKV